jgi:hypothetical protein
VKSKGQSAPWDWQSRKKIILVGTLCGNAWFFRPLRLQQRILIILNSFIRNEYFSSRYYEAIILEDHYNGFKKIYSSK